MYFRSQAVKRRLSGPIGSGTAILDTSMVDAACLLIHTMKHFMPASAQCRLSKMMSGVSAPLSDSRSVLARPL